MNFYILLLLAIGLSVDSFAISIGVGCQRGAVSWRGLRYALIMGVMHTALLWVGWAIGWQFHTMVEKYDHWIVFAVFAFIGIRMINQSLKPSHKNRNCNEALSLRGGAIVALVASVDALLTGGALSLEGINFQGAIPGFITGPLGSIGITQSHTLAFIFIGLVVSCVSLVGLIIGKGIGLLVEKWAGVIGGAILTLFGLWVLLSHTNIL